jgi:hypothetical protein
MLVIFAVSPSDLVWHLLQNDKTISLSISIARRPLANKQAVKNKYYIATHRLDIPLTTHSPSFIAYISIAVNNLDFIINE